MSVNKETMLVYLKNERGVVMPCYLRKEDKIERLWNEVVDCKQFNGKFVGDKALFYKGRRLHRNDIAGDIGITYYDSVELLNLHKVPTLRQFSESQKDLEKAARTVTGFNEV